MSKAVYFIADSVAHGLCVFVRYSQYNGGYEGFAEEKNAIDEAKKRAQQQNRSLTIIKIVADVFPEPILPSVTVTRT